MRNINIERTATNSLQPLTLEELNLVAGGTLAKIINTTPNNQDDQNGGSPFKDEDPVDDPNGGPNEPGSGDRDIG